MLKYLTILIAILSVLALNSFGQAPSNRVQAKLKSFPNGRPPDIPADKQLHGQFTAILLVDKKGEVTKVEEIVGPDWTCPEISDPDLDLLRDAARSIAESTTFVPATEFGKPVETRLQLTFNFKAPDNSKAKGSDSAAVAFSAAPALASVDPNALKGGVVNGKALKLAKPKFPEEARVYRIFGTVNVQVLILEDGRIYSAEPISGEPILWSESRLAACRSKFTSTTLGGQPVKVSGIITYKFSP